MHPLGSTAMLPGVGARRQAMRLPTLVAATLVSTSPAAAQVALAGTDSSASVVFSAVTDGGLTLNVYDNDSFVLGPSGTVATPSNVSSGTGRSDSSKPWLRSGAVGFHTNGTWYLSTAASGPAAPVCSTVLADTDCHGDDISFFNCTQSAECCAACNATPGCSAWTLTGDTTTTSSSATSAARVDNRSLSADADPPWAYRCYLKTDCAGKEPYIGHTSGVVPRPPADVKPLLRVSTGPVQGQDPTLGPFEGWSIRYVGGGVPFVCTFKWFPGSDAIVFEHSFPEGVTALNTTCARALNVTTTGAAEMEDADADGAGVSADTREFSSATAPSTAFPSWISDDDAPDLG